VGKEQGIKRVLLSVTNGDIGGGVLGEGQLGPCPPARGTEVVGIKNQLIKQQPPNPIPIVVAQSPTSYDPTPWPCHQI